MRVLRLIAILVALTGAAGAQAPTPIGPASWKKPNGDIQRAMGMGGAPTLNYWDGTQWDEIVDDWVQVGAKQVWKSTRGNHRVFADSTGAAIYAKGNHFLGISPGPLVKFDKSDSTWVTLKPSVPDSVSISGRTITFHNVYPHMDLRLVNNAKVFRRFAYQVVFHQQARDSLAAWGPWTGFLLGTAMKLNVDSLNLTLRGVAGVFGLNATGRMVNDWVSLGSADTSAFYLGTAYLQTEDSTTSIPVKKWIVRFAGSPWLVELFDPIAAGALPAGDVWHNAIFGHDTNEAASLAMGLKIKGDTATMGAVNGTLTSMSAYLSSGGGTGGQKKKYAIYNNSGGALLGQTIEEDPGSGTTAWHTIAASGTVSLVADTKYVLCAWTNFATNIYLAFNSGSTTKTKTQAYNGFPSTIFWVTDAIDGWKMSIYATYTEDSVSPRRRKILLGGN